MAGGRDMPRDCEVITLPASDIHHWWRFRGDEICFYRGTEDTALTQAMLRAD